MSKSRLIRTTLTVTLATATLAWSGPALALVVESLPPASWQVPDTVLGFTNPVVETFEDAGLEDGLTYQITSTASPSTTATQNLPALFDPAADTFGNAFTVGAWDGTHGILNTADNQSHTYSDAASWGTVTFFFFDGASRVGLSLENMQKAATLSINGVALGAIGTLPGTKNIALSSGRNGYLIVSSGDSGPIQSISIANGPGDGWMVDHLLFQRPAEAVMAFLPDDMNGKIHRYLITRDQATLMGSIPATSPAGVAVSPSGELFVTDLQGGTVLRFQSPQGAATPGTPFGAPLLHHAEEARFVDGELWVVDSDLAGTTNPAALVRFGFDSAGTATTVGSVTAGLLGANRALLWNPVARELFVSQCCATSAIVRIAVAADRATTTPVQGITGNGLANPHGMVITAWGELMVANANDNRILRFILDPAGGARANGAIIGNGLTYPIGLAITPWGQLLAVNQGNNTVSRFTLIAPDRIASAGTFAVNPEATGSRRSGWIALAPIAAACAPANAPACRGTTDAGVDSGGGGGAGGGDAGVRDAAATDAPGTAVDARIDQVGPSVDAKSGARGGGGCGCAVGRSDDSSSPNQWLATALLLLGAAYFRGRKRSVIASDSGTSGKNCTR